MRFVLVLTVALMTTACTASIDMFPVEGPFSERVPLPSASAVAHGITGNSGRLEITLPDGDTCTGRWSSVAPQMHSVTSGSLFGTYAAAAGFSAVTSGNVPGVNRGEAFAVCTHGTTVEAEFFTGSGTANGYGVARDSRGNIYRMLF